MDTSEPEPHDSSSDVNAGPAQDPVGDGSDGTNSSGPDCDGDGEQDIAAQSAETRNVLLEMGLDDSDVDLDRTDEGLDASELSLINDEEEQELLESTDDEDGEGHVHGDGDGHSTAPEAGAADAADVADGEPGIPTGTLDSAASSDGGDEFSDDFDEYDEDDEQLELLLEQIESENIAQVQQLLDAEEDDLLLNMPDEDDISPLMYAVSTGNLRLVQALLDRKADITHTTGDGLDALSTAIREKNAQMGSLLLGFISEREELADAQRAQWSNQTPIALAIKCNAPDFIHILAAAKAALHGSAATQNGYGLMGLVSNLVSSVGVARERCITLFCAVATGNQVEQCGLH